MREKILIELSKILDAMDKKMINELCKILDIESSYAEDDVHSPNHYIGTYGLEVEEVLRNFIPRYENAYVAHRIGSAIEYLLRAPLKNGKQDLEKARYNIKQALDELDKKNKKG